MSTKLYRVAVLGNQDNPPESYHTMQCTIKLFDLTVDEICAILEKMDNVKGLNHEESGLKAMMTYDIQGGGRLFPPVSRQSVAAAMQGVEVLIAVVSSAQLNWVYWEVFECMIEDNLMEKCAVVLKLLEDTQSDNKSACFITADNALQNCGFMGDKWKGDACILADVKLGGQGIKKGIAEVRARLLAEELTASVSRPVKETMKAGRSFIRVGHSFIRWFGKVVK